MTDEMIKILYSTPMKIHPRKWEQITLLATVGETIFEDGHRNTIKSRDFLVSNKFFKYIPKRGDLLTEFIGDEEREDFEVYAPNKEPCFRYCDPYKRILRIHTREVRSEDARQDGN